MYILVANLKAMHSISEVIVTLIVCINQMWLSSQEGKMHRASPQVTQSN